MRRARWLLASFFISIVPGPAAAQLFDALAIAICAKLPDDAARLKCYDAAVKKVAGQALPEWTVQEHQDPINDRKLTTIARHVADDEGRYHLIGMRCTATGGPDLFVSTPLYFGSRNDEIDVTHRFDAEDPRTYKWSVYQDSLISPAARGMHDQIVARLLTARRFVLRFSDSRRTATLVVPVDGFAAAVAAVRDRCNMPEPDAPAKQ